MKYLPKEHDEFPELLLNKGDLLIQPLPIAVNCVGILKRRFYTGSPNNQCSFASYLIRVRFNSGIEFAEVVAHYLNSMYGKNLELVRYVSAIMDS